MTHDLLPFLYILYWRTLERGFNVLLNYSLSFLNSQIVYSFDSKLNNHSSLRNVYSEGRKKKWQNYESVR